MWFETICQYTISSISVDRLISPIRETNNACSCLFLEYKSIYELVVWFKHSQLIKLKVYASESLFILHECTITNDAFVIAMATHFT